MLKILCSFIFFCVPLSASAVPTIINSIEDLESLQTVAERPGMYVFRLSAETAKQIINSLESTFTPSLVESDEFRELLNYMIYPHPSKLNGVRQLWKDFTEVTRLFREIFGVDERRLPHFSGYTDMPTVAAALKGFDDHVARSMSTAETQIEPAVVRQIIDGKLEEIQRTSQKRLDDYAAFYKRRESPFRKHDIERYIMELLNVNPRTPIDDKDNTILGILTERGCLELQGIINHNVFTYSPRLMIEEYISKKGYPTKVVLGCGHANTRDMLEALGLKAETWCGACKELPHDDAMVVSLDESSADIVCDLNHPDIWGTLRGNSLQEVRDETWTSECYKPETITSIVRVLAVGGTFFSTTATPELKTTFERLGLVIVEENRENSFIRLRKVR